MSALTFPQALWQSLWQPLPIYQELKTRKGLSWIPFVLIMVAFCVVQTLYFNNVDWAWYQSQMLEPSLQSMPSKDRATVLAEMTMGRMLTAQLSIGILGMLVANALMAFYLAKMTLVDDDNVQGFGDWFGLTWWCNLVVLVPSLVALVWVLFSSGEISPGALSPLSLNRLLDLPVGHAGMGLAEALSLVLPWKIWLYYSGIRAWTRIAQDQALLIAALPAVVVYGCWGLFLLF
ncbi:YIP1 family protein [Ferrimonas balearica]|uniref:YIP1 family protein n=1 Tax=Ferrimonas balearica TaxID=44012 RepID=UPI001C95E3F7|nr:YIP1 family protein [Ferrimonas balearica]MBY6223820.1 YIP1 family protein [Ferrimonas balearica]